MGWLQTTAAVMAGAGILIGGIAYAYSVYNTSQDNKNKDN